MRIDPELTVLSTISFTPPFEMLEYQIANSDDMIGRLLAIGLLLRVRLRPITVRHLAIRVLGIRPATAALDVPILPSLDDSKGQTVRRD